jgi:Spy/CpxP family protein refolding chaperone
MGTQGLIKRVSPAINKEVSMRKKILIASLGSILLLSTGVSGLGRAALKHKMRLERMARTADLSLEQKAGLSDLFYESKKEMIRLKAEIKVTRLEIARLIQDVPSDENRILSLIEELADLHKQRMKLKVQKIFGIRKILTAEQLRKLEDAKIRKHWRKRERREEREARRERRSFRDDDPSDEEEESFFSPSE